jgi:hypothetical protein
MNDLFCFIPSSATSRAVWCTYAAVLLLLSVAAPAGADGVGAAPVAAAPAVTAAPVTPAPAGVPAPVSSTARAVAPDVGHLAAPVASTVRAAAAPAAERASSTVRAAAPAVKQVVSTVRDSAPAVERVVAVVDEARRAKSAVEHVTTTVRTDAPAVPRVTKLASRAIDRPDVQPSRHPAPAAGRGRPDVQSHVAPSAPAPVADATTETRGGSPPVATRRRSERDVASTAGVHIRGVDQRSLHPKAATEAPSRHERGAGSGPGTSATAAPGPSGHAAAVLLPLTLGTPAADEIVRVRAASPHSALLLSLLERPG